MLLGLVGCDDNAVKDAPPHGSAGAAVSPARPEPASAAESAGSDQPVPVRPTHIELVARAEELVPAPTPLYRMGLGVLPGTEGRGRSVAIGADRAVVTGGAFRGMLAALATQRSVASSFQRSAGGWRPTGWLTTSGLSALTLLLGYSRSVTLSSDDCFMTLAGEDPTQPVAGRVAWFHRDSFAWRLVGWIGSDVDPTHEYVGRSLASGDGFIAFNARSARKGVGDATYVYAIDCEAERWSLLDTIAGLDGAEAGSAVCADGRRLVVASPAGLSLYEVGEDAVSPVLTISRPEAASRDFGHAVALCGDAIAVADPGHAVGDADAVGAVYVYSGSDGGWGLSQTLLPWPVVPSGNSPRQQFGFSLDLSSAYLAVGAPGGTVHAWVGRSAVSDRGWIESPGGVVYTFRATDTGFLPHAALTAYDPLPGAGFGYSVDIHESTVIASGYRPEVIDSEGTSSLCGGVSVFELDAVTPQASGPTVLPLRQKRQQ